VVTTVVVVVGRVTVVVVVVIFVVVAATVVVVVVIVVVDGASVVLDTMDLVVYHCHCHQSKGPTGEYQGVARGTVTFIATVEIGKGSMLVSIAVTSDLAVLEL
jgi:hypothetical protein